VRYVELVGDWFFEKGKLTSHVLVDDCKMTNGLPTNFGGKHSLSSTTSRPRSMIAVLDLARVDYHPVVSSASTRSVSRIAAIDEQVNRSPIEAAPQVLFTSAVSLP
jgi:hypothetical protein